MHQLFSCKFFQSLIAFIAMASLSNFSEAGTVSGVGGTIIDGKSITISGSSFGATGPNIVVFDDFESGTIGSNIKTGTGSAKYGQWNNEDPGGSHYYGNTASVSGTKAFNTDYSVNYSNYIAPALPTNTRRLFISWWFYLPAGNNIPGENTAAKTNWKGMWVQGVDTGTDDLVIPTFLDNGAGGVDYDINGNDTNPGYVKYITLNFSKGHWEHLWVWLKGETTDGSSDGQVKLWEMTSSGVVQRDNDTATNVLKASGSWKTVHVNGYGRQTSNCITSFDDVYIATGDNAQARVEIGNSPTYANSTNLTILTPTSWSDNSITATVNLGQFKSGNTAYLFVVDASGTASNGYPVTIGTGSVAPSPPNNVTIH